MTSQMEEWLELESDPGLFTMLLENIGVKGVQVEDIYDLTEEIKEEIFGFVFLFKWHEDNKKGKRSQSNSDQTRSNSNLNDGKNIIYETNPEKLKEIYFAHQVIPNSCATNALLSVLMNCHDKIQIGPVLTKFRDITLNMTPDKRGAALGNMPELADAHNKRARYLRPHDPLTSSSTQPYSMLCSSPTTAGRVGNSTDSASALDGVNSAGQQATFHFVSYMPIGDGLYELDGLQPYPIWHGTVSNIHNSAGTSESKNGGWSRLCLELIRARMTQHPHYSLMALVRDRRRVLADQLSVLNKNKSVLKQALLQLEKDTVSPAVEAETVLSLPLPLATEDAVPRSDKPIETVCPDTESSAVKPLVSTQLRNTPSRKRRSSTRVSLRNRTKPSNTAASSTPSSETEIPNKRGCFGPTTSDDGSLCGSSVKQEERLSGTEPDLAAVAVPGGSSGAEFASPVDVMRPISIDISTASSNSVHNSVPSSPAVIDRASSSVDSASNTPSSSAGVATAVPPIKYPTRASTKLQRHLPPSSGHPHLPSPHFSPDQIKHLLQVVDESIKNCKGRMSDEIEKHNKYITDDIRRSFNYNDFIHAFLFALKKQGLLEKLLDEQRQHLSLMNRGAKRGGNSGSGGKSRSYRSSATYKRIKMVNNLHHNADPQEPNIGIFEKKITRKSIKTAKKHRK